tara:strand:- start:108 stop:821 length:714 start_codon:yes stop_codon:yes gene_type:complete
MVNIDTVYQRVLAFANKEQRGYITPQEFNLFANQAQMEIYEQYHYDVNNFEMRDGTYNLNSDTTELTRKKLDVFLQTNGPNVVDTFPNGGGNSILLPDYVYRLSRVEVAGVEAEYVDTNRFKDIVTSGPLVRPTPSRPVYTEHRGRLKVNDGQIVILNVGIHFYNFPSPVSWGYFVLSDKALYDGSPNKTTHFELHPSEETELVYKILKFAGISMAKLDIMRAGQIQEQSQQQIEKQ